MAHHLRTSAAIAMSCAVALTLWASLPAAAQEDQSIVPGERIGAVRIGMTERELYGLLGAPASSFKQPDGSIVYEFGAKPHRRSVTTDEGKVYRLGTQDPDFRTKEGVHVGSSLLEVRAFLGQPDCEDSLPGSNPPLSSMVYGSVSYVFTSGVVSEIMTKKTRFRCD